MTACAHRYSIVLGHDEDEGTTAYRCLTCDAIWYEDEYA